jgi:hypothetical protein
VSIFELFGSLGAGRDFLVFARAREPRYGSKGGVGPWPSVPDARDSIARPIAENPFDFSGRFALVTGCRSAAGIGFAAAHLLVRFGAGVAITSTIVDRIEARKLELRAQGADVFARVADLTDRDQVFKLVTGTQALSGRSTCW